jgi:dephospho-CoA kinase
MQHIIGLTGGIGSGKSTIAQELAKHGFVVYDCDREAKRIIAENNEVQQAIIGLLSEEAFVEGNYNTAYVAQRVFADPHLRQQLNQIIHPAVLKDIKDLKNITAPKDLIVESAILCEAGLDSLCDKIIVVEAPEEIRIERVLARDYKGDASPANRYKVRARIQAQANAHDAIPQQKRLTIVNDGQTPIAELVQSILTNS